MKHYLSTYLPLLFFTLVVSACSVSHQQSDPVLITKNAPTNSQVSKSITKQTTHSYTDVASTVTSLQQQYGADDVLIVLDIDNTILTSTTDIGSDVWYQWQRNKLSIKPTQSQKVSCLFEDSIGLLYELSPMKLAEKNVDHTISSWQKSGHTVMALTSRAPQYRAATERELGRNKVNLASSALLPIGQDSMLLRETMGREISYMQGVMMTSGMNKGEMLQYLLDKTGRKFSAIVFVDDSIKNINNIYAAYQNVTDLDMRIFHYTRIEDERDKLFGKVLTQDQANNMAQQWTQLNNTLQHIFPARNLAQGCLTL